MNETYVTPSQKALKMRKRVKRKKPNFVRPESWRYVRLKENWRNPKGLDHKVRLMYKGWPPAASVGYGGPKIARHLHPSGYGEVLVHNTQQLSRVKSETQAARIAHTVGRRKRVRILTEARKKKIIVLNMRETAKAVEEKTVEEKQEEKTEENEEDRMKETGRPEKRTEEQKSTKLRRKTEKP